MESKCNQTCFDVDDIVDDDHDFADENLSLSTDLCNGEVDKIVGQSLNNAAIEPYVDMEFKSRDDAREYYMAYGRHTGFTVRTHHNRRSRINNMVIGQDFVCSKEGFREKKYVHRKDRVLPPSPITRAGCPAMMRLAVRDGDKWVVTKFIKEHNHELMSPSKVPWRGSARNMISEDEKDQRIRQLTIELNNERQRCKRRCAAYQEQLHVILEFVEDHTNHLSSTVQEIVNNIKESEVEKSEV